MTGRVTERLVRKEARSKKPFFIWWSAAAPHREDVAVTLMGRPGPDPRPAPRYAEEASRLRMPRPPSFNEADLSDKPSNMRNRATALTAEQIAQLELDYQGRIGSLRAVDDHVGRLVRTLRSTGQLEQHSDHVRVGQRLDPWPAPHHGRQVPALRGVDSRALHPARPRGAAGPDRRAARSRTSTLPPHCSTSPGPGPDAPWTACRCGRAIKDPRRRPDRTIQLEAPEPLFAGNIPINGWDRPYSGVRTDRYTYVVYRRRARRSCTTARRDRYQLNNVAGDPAYARIEAVLARRLERLRRCRGRSCSVPG